MVQIDKPWHPSKGINKRLFKHGLNMWTQGLCPTTCAEALARAELEARLGDQDSLGQGAGAGHGELGHVERRGVIRVNCFCFLEACDEWPRVRWGRRNAKELVVAGTHGWI